MTKQDSKPKKTITEIFYDEWDNEIKPGDPEYEKYLNGEEYFGSYFIDTDGKVVKEIDPTREEDSAKKLAKRTETAQAEATENASASDIAKAIALAIGLALVIIVGWFLIKAVIIPIVIVILIFFFYFGSKSK